MAQRRFDSIIVGAGQAGPALAERLGKAGRSVAIVPTVLQSLQPA